MKAAFQTYLNSYLEICPHLSEDELNYIHSNLSISEIKKGDFYLNAGDIQEEMGFVYDGLLRSYYIGEDGKKVTIGFISENQYAADYPSFIQQKPSKYCIEALEPCIMVNLSYVKIQEAYELYKNFENYGRLIAERILIEKQDRIESFLFTNAEQRYLDFVNSNKKITNRISLSHLSSCLGIERQSLSRIRKKIVKK